MNTTYRSIWNASLGCYVAAPECAATHRSGTSVTRSVRCREPLRAGSQMVLESRVLFDGAMVATMIEQDSASQTPEVEAEPEPEAVDTVETGPVVEATDAAVATEEPEADAAATESEAAPGDSPAAPDSTLPAAVANDDTATAPDNSEDADTPLATLEPSAAPSVEVVFVDGRVPDVASFQAPGREVIVLSLDQDGIAQIASALNGRTDIDAIHIVSHGGDGYLSLGSGQITTESIQSVHLQSLQLIGQSLSAEGDILIYACDYASGESGLEAMSLLADITGADVAASVDATGHESLGADWTLEQSTGEVEAVALAPLAWMNALDFTFTGAATVGAIGMANNIMGAGVTVVSATYQGGDTQSGTFTAGSGVTFGSNVLGFTSGTILSTGSNAAGVAGPNSSPGYGDNAPGVDGDPTLDAMAGFPTFDAAILNISFIPDVPPGGEVGDVGRMTLEIVFGSDEYLEYVGSINDVMEVTVNGQVVSLVPNSAGGESTIGINSVNTTQNPSLFIDNAGATYNTQMDAFTVTIPMVFDIIVGQTNTIRLAVADAVDDALDSWLFIRADSGQTVVVAEDDQVATAANLPITVDLTANDYSLAGGSMTLTQIQGQAVTQGQVITLGSGIQLTVGSGGQVTVTGNGSSAANDTFTYQVSNGMGGIASATVNVEVTAPNLNPPVAQDDVEAVLANATLSDSVLTNNGNGADSDPNGDPLSVVQVNLTGFTAGSPMALPSGALLTMNSNGTYVYDPNGAFDGLASGSTADDSFSYTITDGQGGNATATVTVTVTGVAVGNSAPVAVDDNVSTDEDTVVYIGNLHGNDTDADGDALSASDVGTVGSQGGRLAADDAGNWVFNPNGDFDQLADGETAITSFTYTVGDPLGASDTGTVTVTVTGVNDAPVGTNSTVVGNEDTPLSLGGLTGNFVDPEGDALFLSMNTTAGSNGGLFSMDDGGAVSFNPNGEFDALAVGESVATSFVYTVFDANGASGSATLTVIVEGRNDAPTPVNDHFFGTESGALAMGSPLANDTDPEGDSLHFSMNTTQGTGGGWFSMDDSGGVFFNPGGDFTDLVVGQTRDTGFIYTVTDSHGASALATLTVTVYGSNSAPVTADDDYIAYARNPVVLGNPVLNDTDPEGDSLSLDLIGAASNGGEFQVVNGNELSFNPNGAFDDLSDGESRTTSITYSVSDAFGGVSVANATVTVWGLNDNPAAVNDSFAVGSNTAAFLGNVLNNDSDVDGDPLQTDAMLDQAGSAGGLFSISASGDISFNTNGDFDDLALGQTRDTQIEYTVHDGLGGSHTALATVTVSGTGEGAPVDPPPPVVMGFSGDEGGFTGEGLEPAVSYSNEVVFVDARVADPYAFAADGREVILLNLEEDGLSQIAAALAGRTEIAALHIISHGGDGFFTLGSGEVNIDTMQTTQRDWLEAIGQTLTVNGDILIYACDFASTETGLAAMNLLAEITVADVAASLYTTGHETLGADWTLEARVGTVEASEVVPYNWDHDLGLPPVTGTPVQSAPTPPVVQDTPSEVVVGAPDATEPGSGEPLAQPGENLPAEPTEAPVRAPAIAVAKLVFEAQPATTNAVLDPAAPSVQAVRMQGLEAAVRQVWQSLETTLPAKQVLPVGTPLFVGVDTTTEWTQQHAADAVRITATAWEAPATDAAELEEELAGPQGAVDAGTATAVRAERQQAAQGFRAQLDRWASGVAQNRPLVRAVARG